MCNGVYFSDENFIYSKKKDWLFITYLYILEKLLLFTFVNKKLSVYIYIWNI